MTSENELYKEGDMTSLDLICNILPNYSQSGKLKKVLNSERLSFDFVEEKISYER